LHVCPALDNFEKSIYFQKILIGEIVMQDNSFDDSNQETQHSFASLLDTYSPPAGTEIQVGDKVQGHIISIGKDTVFVETGTKIDGVVDRSELLDEEGNLLFAEGDLLELFVVSKTEDEIKLSKAISGIGGLHMLREAYEKEIPVEGRIKETCKGGFNVEVLQRRAFCPLSQLEIDYVENPSEYVGGTHRFIITQFEENGKNIVLSRRAILARELEKSRAEFYKDLTLGMTLAGKVKRIMPYGVFVELSAGVEGMVHISELSWSKTITPDAVVNTGDPLTVKVISIEPASKSDRIKIALSVKQLSEDPWLTAAEHYREGDKMRGQVTRCVDFGAFVEVAPGIEGLVHISEMSYKKRIVNPQDIVSEGDTVAVLVKEVDAEKRRLSLSIRDAEGDPWLEVPEKFCKGDSIEGLIEKKEKFGYFINLAPGITGLMPKSHFGLSSKPGRIESLNEGDRITVVIGQINTAERKITLAPADAATEQDWQKYAAEHQPSLGSLGEKLQQALASKEATASEEKDKK
jgi:small subunit ribosomal protein S1